VLSHPSPDLRVPAPPPVAWNPQEAAASLHQLYDWAQQVAIEAIDWYLTEKRRKARWSRGLRAATAILTAAGGAVPVAALSAGRPALGNWGFVLLALAAGCLAFDRYFGYSSAWLRYVSTATALRRLLNDFQLRWTRELAGLGDQNPSPEEIVRCIDLARDFTGTVHEAIQSETESWLTEFHTRLNELETRISESSSDRAAGRATQ
jgi:conflict system pore-forming effector with SLATT domain